MNQVYDFQTQLKKGESAEYFLDSVFAREFEITTASRQEQKRGIDRWFKKRNVNSPRFSVEYKTDWRAAETHNAFVETVSVDTEHKPGWAYTCQSSYLLYYVPIDELVYIIKPVKLKNKIDRWIHEYTEKSIDNKSYCTKGVPVPLHEFESIAERVISL